MLHFVYLNLIVPVRGGLYSICLIKCIFYLQHFLYFISLTSYYIYYNCLCVFKSTKGKMFSQTNYLPSMVKVGFYLN